MAALPALLSTERSAIQVTPIQPDARCATTGRRFTWPRSSRTVRAPIAWASRTRRPLDRLSAVLVIDAIVIKVRDAQVANRPVYVAIGVTSMGNTSCSACGSVPPSGDGAKQWTTMLTELRNRGVADALRLGPATGPRRECAPAASSSLQRLCAFRLGRANA